MRTVEPIYNDINHPIEGSRVLQDDTIAFIYDTIKKHEACKKSVQELKEYIKNVKINGLSYSKYKNERNTGTNEN